MTLAFNFIGIATNDLGASLSFYRQLGLDIPTGLDDAPHVEVALGGGVTLAWDPVSTIQGFKPGFELPRGEGRIGFAVEAESPADVDRTYAAIVAKNPQAAHTAPWDAPWGQRYSTVLDPDGNSIDVYAALPAAAEAAAAN
ncbi:VOC family protein [Leucobacter luti]|uniref:Glyoxalase/bleomycin resistance protein/dioxygenase superfamily protein n=1 Tax=Leucobacter luti TaxID=340320 RepID=A0A4R6RZ89_9MICO|nr:VOC family protein [Leucobacter luti]QYM76214.1 VOC family protein [Leucobacter luti]TDP92481.1 glyoxalase/bleomycin resistance protein/dioxygenase superfamily protein [Leucobacter luti]